VHPVGSAAHATHSGRQAVLLRGRGEGTLRLKASDVEALIVPGTSATTGKGVPSARWGRSEAAHRGLQSPTRCPHTD